MNNNLLWRKEVMQSNFAQSFTFLVKGKHPQWRRGTCLKLKINTYSFVSDINLFLTDELW